MAPGDDREAGPADVTAGAGETSVPGGTGESRTAAGGADWEGAPVHLGARMGRYELRSLVGSGGMGVVFEALDPELDRVVAVKILRSSSGVAGSDGERRLRREGQTMARLTHPNVLRVYDVGVDRGQVFVAMEFVAGGTLADWLKREPRTPEEILAVFVQAGRGLAAAHDAGLVHRDFKPANVLVDGDGRVLVTDFGLARAASADADSISGDGRSSPASVVVTREGQTVGTPAYMAPEQHAGAPVDARADQFSFCVSLWRALFGAAPFDGATPAELAVSTARGTPSPPPVEHAAKVPPRVRAALERGLRAAPEARWPSMRELLAALEPPPPRARWWWFAVPAAVVATAAVVFGLSRDQRVAAPTDVCAAQGDHFAEVWNPQVAAGIRAAFAATKVPYAETAYAELVRQLDGRAVAWEAMRRQSCEATRVHRAQSDGMMDVRAACLEQRLDDVRELVTVLGHADEPAVRGVASAAAVVGDLTACGDVATLSRRAPLPPEPARRDAIAAVERELSAARAQAAAGRDRQVAALSDGLIARARATGYSPVVAEALRIASQAQALIDKPQLAEKLLEEAVLAAEAGGDDLLRFDCELALIRVVGYALERDQDGGRHAQRAGALLTRLGPDLRRSGLLAKQQSTLAWWHGRYDEALAHAQEAVALFTKLDPQGADLAGALHGRALVEDELGDNHATIATETQALAVAERAMGADHPTVAHMWGAKGGGLRRLGRYDEARAAHGRGRDILLASYGADSLLVGTAWMNLATIELDDEKFDQATEMLRTALAIIEKAVGPDHTRTALAYERLGASLSKGGHHGEAEVALLRALEIHRTKMGKDAPQTASSSKQLGEHFMRAKQPAQARTWYREAIRGYQASQGADSSMATRAYAGLGEAELALGHRAAAIAAYERAIAVARSDDQRSEYQAKLDELRAARP